MVVEFDPFIIYFSIHSWNTLIALILPFLTTPVSNIGSEPNRIHDIYYVLSINLHMFHLKWVVWPFTITFSLQPVQIFGRKMALSGHHGAFPIAQLIMRFWTTPFKWCRWKSMPALHVTPKHAGRWATGEAHMLKRHASFSYYNTMAEGCYRWSCLEKITSFSFWQRKKKAEKKGCAKD